MKDKSLQPASISKNYVFSVMYKLLNIVMPLITAPYLSKIFGAEGVGTFAYYYAIAHYFYIVGKMGLNNYGTRQVAQHKNAPQELNETVSSIFLQQLISTGIILIVYILFCLTQIKNGSFLPAILGFYVVGSMIDIDWIWCGLEKFDKIAIKNMSVKIVTLAAIFLLVKVEGDLWKYTLIISLGMLGGFITLWFGVRKYVKWQKATVKEALVHFVPNLLLLFPILASNIYRSMDKVMLGSISTKMELGYYDNAEKIVYGISGLITAFTTVMMPRCANLLAKSEHERYERTVHQATHIIFFIIFGCAFGCAALSERIILCVFGEKFIACIPLLQILVVTLIPMVISEIVRSMWIIPQKKDRVYIISLTVGATVNLIANSILIPSYRAVGASIATIFAEVSVPIVQYAFTRKELNYQKMLKSMFPYLMSGVIMGLCIGLMSAHLENSVLNLLVLCIVGALIFFVTAMLLVRITDKMLFYMLTRKVLAKLKNGRNTGERR